MSRSGTRSSHCPGGGGGGGGGRRTSQESGGGFGGLLGLNPANAAALLVAVAALCRAVSQEVRLEEVEAKVVAILEGGGGGGSGGERAKREAAPEAEASVEFVHPGYKGELAKHPGTAAEWLTTYARVPVMETFLHSP